MKSCSYNLSFSGLQFAAAAERLKKLGGKSTEKDASNEKPEPI